MPEKPVTVLPGRDVKTLWFSLRRMREWRTLALVSVDAAPVGKLAHRLAQMAALAPKRNVLVIDAMPRAPGAIVQTPAGHYGVKAMREGMPEVEMLSAFVPDAAASLANAALDVVLVAAPNPIEYTHTIPLISAADAIVLCVALGTSRFGLTRETFRHMDHERLLGTVLLGEA